MLDERTIPDAQLPTWMQQARRGVDWGVIIVMILSIFVAWPLIANRHLPAYTALENYAFQVNDASTSILQGWFFPRWSATALNGYGTPLPHYQPSAAADVAAFVNVLFLNDPERVIRVVMIAAFLLAGSTTYVLVMQRSGAQTGMLAAALYLFSPYVALMTPYVRGDLPEVLSLAAMPTLLWAINRQLQRNQPLDSLAIAISTAFILLNDPLWLLLSLLPITALFLDDFRANWRRTKLVTISGSILLGIGVASFFWLPALLEKDIVRWLPPLVQSRTEPISFLGLFARTETLDPAALVHYPQWNLGWALLIFVNRSSSSR
ncbi:MAG: glycosyltransferase family 39 protein, partial [Anaerolineae bacterium]|nr:glycosyltransferase family 39 protein [Anaerolineae bacterium]